MSNVTYGGKAAQVTDECYLGEFGHLKSDARTEHLQRNLTRIIDRWLAEEDIANKGPGSRVVVRRAFESKAICIKVDIIAGYEPPVAQPPCFPLGWHSAAHNPPTTARYVLLTKRIAKYPDRLPVPEIARYLPGEGVWCRIADQAQIMVNADPDWVWHELPGPVAA